MLLRRNLYPVSKLEFEWWNLRTFVFIEKVLANDHIIYPHYIYRSKTLSDLNYAENFNLIVSLKCHEKWALPETKLLSCQFYFNSTNYKKPQIVTDLLNIGPQKPSPRWINKCSLLTWSLNERTWRLKRLPSHIYSNSFVPKFSNQIAWWIIMLMKV